MKKIVRFLMVIIVAIGVGGLYFLSNSNNFKTEIIEFDNFYNENNIEIFYEEADERLVKINETFKVNSFLENVEGEMNKALRVVDVVNSIAEYDEVKDSGATNAFNILKDVTGRKKMSGKDMAIIYRDLLYSIGIKARVGEFRNERNYISKDKRYYVVEYWSVEESKWIMIDFIEKGYFKSGDKILSAVEVISNNKEKIFFEGKIEDKVYKEKVFNIFETYTINIDNTLDRKKSNSVLTYVESDKALYLEHANKYLEPTIFTEKNDIFLNNPEYKSEEKDSKPYIIMMKQSGENTKFTVAAFMDGKVVDDYYMKVGNGDYTKESKYSEVNITENGITIEVSLDGEKTDSMIEVKMNF